MSSISAIFFDFVKKIFIGYNNNVATTVKNTIGKHLEKMSHGCDANKKANDEDFLLNVLRNKNHCI